MSEAGADVVGAAVGLASRCHPATALNLLGHRLDPGVAGKHMKKFALAIADADQRANPANRGLEQIDNLEARLFQVGIEGGDFPGAAGHADRIEGDVELVAASTPRLGDFRPEATKVNVITSDESLPYAGDARGFDLD